MPFGQNLTPQVPFSSFYGSRWVLVCLLVFKTSVSGEELLGWVRFPHTPAIFILGKRGNSNQASGVRTT
jgi:hypothetical protein